MCVCVRGSWLGLGMAGDEARVKEDGEKEREARGWTALGSSKGTEGDWMGQLLPWGPPA